MEESFISQNKTGDGRKTLLILLAVFIIGTLIRLVPWANFITPEGVYLLEGDNYEHLRKIILILSDFPYPPAHDFYIGFPEGTGAIWAPLLDITLAALVKIIHTLTGADAEAVTAALPAPVGMLAAFFLFLWVREIFGTKVALVSALMLALLPSHIFTTIVGRPDNELIEPVFAALTFYLYTRACVATESGLDGTRNSRGTPDCKIIFSGFLTGLALAASLLFWRGALMWWAIVGAHTLVTLIYYGFKGKIRLYKSFFMLGVSTFATAAVIIAIVTSTGLWGTESGIDFNTVSSFHVISALIALSSLFAAYAGFYLHYKKVFLKATKAATLACIIFLSFILIIHLAVPAYFAGIISGAAVVGGGGGGGWIGTIAEYQPLFSASGGILETLFSSSILIIITPLLILTLAVSSTVRRLTAGRDINASTSTEYAYSGGKDFHATTASTKRSGPFVLSPLRSFTIYTDHEEWPLRKCFYALRGRKRWSGMRAHW